MEKGKRNRDTEVLNRGPHGDRHHKKAKRESANQDVNRSVSSSLAELQLPDCVVGRLLRDQSAQLRRLQDCCHPVDILVQSRQAQSATRKVVLSGPGPRHIGQARREIFHFLKAEFGVEVAGIVADSGGHRRSPVLKAVPSSPLQEEVNCSDVIELVEGSIPVFGVQGEQVAGVVDQCRNLVQCKFPETELELQLVEDRDNPELSSGPSHIILIRSTTELSVLIAKFVVEKCFSDKLGISLQETGKDEIIRKLQSKLEETKSTIPNYEADIQRLKQSNEKLNLSRKELEKNRHFWKEKSARQAHYIESNRSEFDRMKAEFNQLKQSYKALKVNERKLKNKLDIMKVESGKLKRQFEDSVSKTESLEREVNVVTEAMQAEIDQLKNGENHLGSDNVCGEECGHGQMIAVTEQLTEKLKIAEGLLQLREQELQLYTGSSRG